MLCMYARDIFTRKNKYLKDTFFKEINIIFFPYKDSHLVWLLILSVIQAVRVNDFTNWFDLRTFRKYFIHGCQIDLQFAWLTRVICLLGKKYFTMKTVPWYLELTTQLGNKFIREIIVSFMNLFTSWWAQL